MNRRYFLEYVRRVAGPGARVLDFGCGEAELVALLQAAGFDAYGVDIRFEGADYRFNDKVLPGSCQYYEEGEKLPFEDETFDVVLSDMVWEHVVPIESALSEVERITKPGGIMYHHFPTREVWREGHIGIPFSHRLPKGQLRYQYTRGLRKLGIGRFQEGRTVDEWTEHSLNWVDNWTVYRSSEELEALFSRNATVRFLELDYCVFRAGDRRLMAKALSKPALQGPSRWLFRRLGFSAWECTKRSRALQHETV